MRAILKLVPADWTAGWKTKNWVCGFCWERAKRKYARNFSFKAARFPCLQSGQCPVSKWDLYYCVFTKRVSSAALGFDSQVPAFCEINTVHWHGPAQRHNLPMFNRQNISTESHQKPDANG